jgi:hypothetical protein
MMLVILLKDKGKGIKDKGEWEERGRGKRVGVRTLNY